MALSKERKREIVAEYVDLLQRSKAIIFTEYRGLSNKEMHALRRTLRDVNGVYRVVKVTLFNIALRQVGYPTLPEDVLGAPLAVGFCLDDVPGVAKAITKYAEEAPLVIVRGGLMDETFLATAQVEAIAHLPPLEVLRAQILGLLDAPAANLVGVIQAGVAQVVNVIHAYVKEGEDGAAAA